MRQDAPEEHHLKHMEYWFERCPELLLAYETREAFLEMFDEKFCDGSRVRSQEAARHFYEEREEAFPAGEKYDHISRLCKRCAMDKLKMA